VTQEGALVVARLDIDRNKFFERQMQRQPAKENDLAALLATYDGLSLEFLLYEERGDVRLVARSLRVHCAGGRFRNYPLTDGDLANMLAGKAISNMFWTHTDSHMPICQEP